jgi:hypothetical protein
MKDHLAGVRRESRFYTGRWLRRVVENFHRPWDSFERVHAFRQRAWQFKKRVAFGILSELFHT